MQPWKILHVPAVDAPVVVRALHLRTCQVNRTNGDGACSIHSVFGEKRRGMYEKNDARQFLRNQFGQDADTFSARLGDVAILNELGSTLWQELVQPCAAEVAGIASNRRAVRQEGNMVWAKIVHGDPAVAMQCVEAASSEHDAYEQFRTARTSIVNEFAKLCVRSLEHTFVRPLLGHLDLLDEYEHEVTEVPGHAVPVT